MSRTVALNALFLVAGCSSELFSEMTHRIAVIVIVLLVRALWARNAMWRAVKFEKQRTLTSLADSLLPPLTRQGTHQYALSEPDHRIAQQSA